MCGGDRPGVYTSRGGSLTHMLKTIIIAVEYPRIKVRDEEGWVYTIRVKEGWSDELKVGAAMELDKDPKLPKQKS